MIQANRLNEQPPQANAQLERLIQVLTRIATRLDDLHKSTEARRVALKRRRPVDVDTARALCPAFVLPPPAADAAEKLRKAEARLRLRCGQHVLAELRALGYRLWVEAGTLRVNGARMTEEAAAKVERHRDGLLLALEGEKQ